MRPASLVICCQLGSLLTLGHSAAFSQELERAAKALDMIAKFANDICNRPELKGSSSTLEVEGKAKAEASKLIKQLADLQIEGAAKVGKSEYEGLVQQDLLPALQDSTRCKERVYNDLRDRFLPKPTSQLHPILNVRADPDTIGVRIGSYTLVDYRFSEVNGVQATVDAQDVRWLLDDGTQLAQVKNARILGGSFTVEPRGSHDLRDNVYMPPDIAQRVLASGANQVQLETTFLADDGSDNRTKARTVLRIGILK